jgi:NTE family protein
MSELSDTVALVLAGGGARGAYEAGALSVLLPVLEERGQRPRIVLGTSVGALNAGFLAANLQRSTAELLEGALSIWESISWGMVAKPLVSTSSLWRAGAYTGEVLGLPGARIESLLDPEPLRATVGQQIDFGQLADNVDAGRLDAAGVVATSASTGRSVVFHHGLSSPPTDDRRGIDYVATELSEDHVLASAAIPGVFPAVHVQRPPVARGWYFDGGTRLNTPVKPALKLGAARVIVIAVNPLPAKPSRLASDQRPDALEAVGQILLGLLEDQLAADVQTLATINTMIADEHVGSASGVGGKRRVPYMLIAPDRHDAIGACALKVVREHYGGPLQTLRSPDLSLLARLTAAGADAQHAELLSFLLFAPEFSRALIELGQADARRWIDQSHDFDELWQLGPLG